MKFQDFVNVFGSAVVGLQDAMVQRAHARFLSFFEDSDDDDIYELKKRLIKFAEDYNVNFSELSGRLLDTMIGDEAEFEISTPIHFTDDAKSIDDVEIVLKSTGFLKSHSHVTMRVKFKHAPAPEGWRKLQDHVDAILQNELKLFAPKPKGEGS